MAIAAGGFPAPLAHGRRYRRIPAAVSAFLSPSAQSRRCQRIRGAAGGFSALLTQGRHRWRISVAAGGGPSPLEKTAANKKGELSLPLGRHRSSFV